MLIAPTQAAANAAAALVGGAESPGLLQPEVGPLMCIWNDSTSAFTLLNLCRANVFKPHVMPPLHAQAWCAHSA